MRYTPEEVIQRNHQEKRCYVLFKKKKTIENDADRYKKLKAEVEALLREGWGPRCKIKDIEDFPEIIGTDSRCSACLVYEKFDAFWDYATPDD